MSGDEVAREALDDIVDAVKKRLPGAEVHFKYGSAFISLNRCPWRATVWVACGVDDNGRKGIVMRGHSEHVCYKDIPRCSLTDLSPDTRVDCIVSALLEHSCDTK